VIKLKRNTISIVCITIASFLVTAGIVYAATTRNITSTLSGTSGDHFDLDGTMIVDSLKVGAQGTGGVTFFNGTIVNNTTNSSGGDNPVTFGDNVRIDGRVYRGATAGTADTMPFIVNDNMELTGNLLASGNSTITGNSTVGGNLAVTGSLTFNNGGIPTRNKIYSGTFDITQDGDEIATYDWGTDCVGDPTYTETTKYHYVKITVPEASLTNPTNVQVYYKVHADYKTGYLPDIEDLWRASDPSISEGYLYLLTKYVNHICDGSANPYYYVDGEYKAVVTY